jgi:hypothetical protein
MSYLLRVLSLPHVFSRVSFDLAHIQRSKALHG